MTDADVDADILSSCPTVLKITKEIVLAIKMDNYDHKGIENTDILGLIFP